MELDLNVADGAPEKPAAMARSDSCTSDSSVLNVEASAGGGAAPAPAPAEEGSSSTPPPPTPPPAVLEFSILRSSASAEGESDVGGADEEEEEEATPPPPQQLVTRELFPVVAPGVVLELGVHPSGLEVPKSVLENLLGMQMADDPNLNFGAFPQPFGSQHVVSFQTSATTSGSGGMPVYLDCSSGMDADMEMLSTAPSVAVSTSSSNMIADFGQNLKYGGPLAADWSYLELQVLKDGLEKYVNEQGIMKYIKIAASLPTKTVRDVAMRCQCLGKKENTRRRKPEEHRSSRKMKDRKDKMVEPSSWGTNHLVQTDIRVSSFVSHNAIQNNQFLSGASEIDRAVQHRLEENNRLLNQIETNILTFQAQNNIDLFHRARRNINDLLQTMGQMPGMMSKMPSLPVNVDDNLASYVLPGLTMAQFLGSSNLKEEPRGW